jgi:hypothetical protein
MSPLARTLPPIKVTHCTYPHEAAELRMLEELRDNGLLETGRILDHERFAILAPARDIGGARVDHVVRLCIQRNNGALAKLRNARMEVNRRLKTTRSKQTRRHPHPLPPPRCMPLLTINGQNHNDQSPRGIW